MAKREKGLTATLDGRNSKHDGMQMTDLRSPAVRIQCPHEGEVVAQSSYTFHISAAPGTESVEVSIDQGDWAACREALGVWWYDWSGFDKGEHQLAARARISAAISLSSAPRLFLVG